MRPGSWVPPVVWMAVIAAFSTASFGAGTTGTIIPPLVGWLLPWLSPEHLDLAHVAVRKAAHLAEYAVLAGLWARGFARDRVLGGRAAAAAAFALSVAWACADEALQSLAAGRDSRPADVLLDAAGAGAALALRPGRWRRTLDLATGALLWIAAAGGMALLAVNAAADVPSGALWITAPGAAVLLVARWWWRRRTPTP
jgi:VanZ family protein